MKFFSIAAAMMLCGLSLSAAAAKTERAIFAGGCFWCMERPFAEASGVLSVTVGYTGGSSTAPTYETYGRGGHLEAVEITYDPQTIPYGRLLDIFWRQIDPTDPDGQFADRGPQYASAIFCLDETQYRQAVRSKAALAASGIFSKPVVTPVLRATSFYPAEEYHQHYYRKNPVRYTIYRFGSGRDRFLERIWGPGSNTTGHRLTPLQYRVTRQGETEPPFDNAYWDHRQNGIYVDIISGEPLFSSTDKFDSGTGWPSFTRPLVPANIVEEKDRRLFTVRTEVRSRKGDSHLGHVFDDGPPPTGRRYCINSAALRFIPEQDLAKEGYGEFATLFGTKRQSVDK